MKRILLPILLSLATAAHAQLIDELGAGNKAGQVIDRNMRDSVSLSAIQEAFDNSDPRETVKDFPYDPGVTYKLRLREFMDTTVVLPPGEEIVAFSLADGKTFEFHPYTSASGKDSRPELRNMFRVLGKYPGADTSLTVVGRSTRIYSFYLRVDSVKSKFVPVLVARIKGAPVVLDGAGEALSHAKVATEKAEAPAGNQPAKDGIEAAKDAEYLRSLDIPTARDITQSYVMSGEKELAPVRVFDDGVWTYFKFSDDNLDRVKRLPTVYRVVDGVDSPVNTRIVNGTLIAETTSAAWTLRNGDSHLCVQKR